jgi:hypothetical protein
VPSSASASSQVKLQVSPVVALAVVALVSAVPLAPPEPALVELVSPELVAEDVPLTSELPPVPSVVVLLEVSLPPELLLVGPDAVPPAAVVVALPLEVTSSSNAVDSAGPQARTLPSNPRQVAV